MKITLDKEIECIINQNYSIDKSVIELIQQRQQLADAAQRTIKDILNKAPSAPPLPEKSDNIITEIINQDNYNKILQQNQINTILEQLQIIDVFVDKIDELIVKLDQIPYECCVKINEEIKKVNDIYNERIEIGCRSDLVWGIAGSTSYYDINLGGIVVINEWTPIKNPNTEIRKNLYGIKYYQKPSNRDYGFEITSEFKGTIGFGASSLAIVSDDNTSNIQVNDQITDSLTNPSVFQIGNLPKVVGFGSTDLLGIVTSFKTNVTYGSSIIPLIGFGDTTQVLIGHYAVNGSLFSSDTKVVGFGTTTTNVIVGFGTTAVIRNIITTSVILDQNSIGLGTDVVIGFATFKNYSTLELSSYPSSEATNKRFYSIRNIEDATGSVSYTKSPLDPVTIGIIDPDKFGLGNKIELSNDGNELNSSTWREVLNDPEPSVGAGVEIYNVGISSWPVITTIPDPAFPMMYNTVFAEEGKIYSSDPSGAPGYATSSPTGINTNGTVCNSYTGKIQEAEAELEVVINENMDTIQKYISASNNLRRIRNDYELRAWSYLQSISYLREQISTNDTNINLIKDVDYNSL